MRPLGVERNRDASFVLQHCFFSFLQSQLPGDLEASPLNLYIYASNERWAYTKDKHCKGKGGMVSGNVIVMVEPGVTLDCHVVKPPLEGATVGQPFYLDVSPSFHSTGHLHYQMRGQPRQSGLSINAQTGIISGTPTESDSFYSPLRLVIVAGNGKDTCTSEFVVEVHCILLP